MPEIREVYICDVVRTPVGRYGGSLSQVRTDDLAALPIRRLMERHEGLDPAAVSDVLLGCANQAGEDNRNVARMALLLAGLPETVPGATINRLCGSGMEAIGAAARAIRTGEAELVIAGGVESMSRAPFVMEKATTAFSRSVSMYDTTIGWRFVNPVFDRLYGTESMMDTAENIVADMQISREDQDGFAFWSQEKASHALNSGLLKHETMEVGIPQRKGDPLVVDTDEHPRKTSMEKLASLKVLSRAGGTITAGNASGVNDGAAALLIASGRAAEKHGLNPSVRILGMAVAGVAPQMMGMGPVPATKQLLERLNLSLDEVHIIELNEAFAAQALGCIRALGLSDRDARINPWGGAIALGHPLGMSGARLIGTAYHQLMQSEAKKALCTMCIGVGQGISMLIEKC